MRLRALTTAEQLGGALASARSGRAAAARARLLTLVRALVPHDVPREGAALVAAVAGVLDGGDRSDVWLTLAVLRAELPLDEEVARTARAIALDGSVPTLASLLLPSANPLERGRELRTVEVATHRVLVDVEHTSHTGLATGIQRVARQTAVRWAAAHDLTFVGWTHDGRAMRRLTPEEEDVALHGGGEDGRRRRDDGHVLVPWKCTYVLPELAVEPPRTARTLGLARWSRCRTGVIGFDCVPLTTAETIGDGMGAAFANSLAAVRHMDRVAAISHAAAAEYLGWRRMLSGTGFAGPDIVPVVLPVEAQAPDPEVLAAARERLGVDETPLVLCVGSHEPRKNHLAVLAAADLAWRTGTRFTLLFVGGHAWRSDEFLARVDELRAAGRPVETITAVSDDLLWSAYVLARCVVFPSLNEGFGLPVAEAIAAGTPAITSDFGSMREIAASGGAVLVDPRDDRALADALRSLVEDDALHARLAAEARRAPRRTWDEYAEELWQTLVVRPAP
ncbi:MAG TPA: glycosyltransferase [Cellulomonas sp.]